MKRLNLISSPRNISTALMYSFAQRSDTIVVDEPFYAYYLSIRSVDHPGRDEIIRSQPTDPREVSRSLLETTGPPVLFIKNMAHHLIDIDPRFYEGVTNILLIRNPRQLIASFAQVIPEPTMYDIGVRKQFDLFSKISESGPPPIVLDSGELMKDPRAVLTALCDSAGISFQESMLSWKPGPRPEDGVWAKYWYANVHRSTGFRVQQTSHRPLAEHLVPLAEEALPLYQALYDHSIKAEG